MLSALPSRLFARKTQIPQTAFERRPQQTTAICIIAPADGTQASIMVESVKNCQVKHLSYLGTSISPIFCPSTSLGVYNLTIKSQNQMTEKILGVSSESRVPCRGSRVICRGYKYVEGKMSRVEACAWCLEPVSVLKCRLQTRCKMQTVGVK